MPGPCTVCEEKGFHKECLMLYYMPRQPWRCIFCTSKDEAKKPEKGKKSSPREKEGKTHDKESDSEASTEESDSSSNYTQSDADRSDESESPEASAAPESESSSGAKRKARTHSKVASSKKMKTFTSEASEGADTSFGHVTKEAGRSLSYLKTAANGTLPPAPPPPQQGGGLPPPPATAATSANQNLSGSQAYEKYLEKLYSVMPNPDLLPIHTGYEDKPLSMLVDPNLLPFIDAALAIVFSDEEALDHELDMLARDQPETFGTAAAGEEDASSSFASSSSSQNTAGGTEYNPAFPLPGPPAPVSSSSAAMQ